MQVSRTFYARGQTGQQLLIGAYQALERQVAAGTVKCYTRHEMLELIVVDGRARGIIVRDLVRARLAEASQAGATTTTVAPIPAPPAQLPIRTPRIPTVALPQGGGRATVLANSLGAGTSAPPSHPVGAASQQDVACWLAAQSRSAGAPGELLVMAALTESGGKNLSYGDRDSVGYFQIRPSTNFAPAGFGIPPETKVSGEWWVQNPDAQAAWARAKIEATAGGDRDADLSDPAALGAWAQSIEQSAYPDRYAQHYDQARELVKGCATQEPRTGGSSALKFAARELGVQEAGTNTGPRVSVYQDTTGAYNAPWCASFVTWALGESGREMPAGNWAAVANWVSAAQAGTAGLEIVSAADARPGDLVAYDWGFGTDFGQDGHIGMLATTVEGGAFEAIEGNYQDAVTHTSRTTGDANIVFIRAT